MNEIIWNYINKSVDNHQVFPDWHTIAEALEHDISLDEFDQIHQTAMDYMRLHDLSNIEVHYEGEPKNKMEVIA